MASDPKRLLWSSRLNALIIPFLLLSLTGCASTSLMGGVNQVGEKMYLTAVPEIPKDIEACMNMQDLSHEESKVNYLLYRIKNSGLPFIRNKARYSSDEAARFLRWKLNRPKWRPLVTSAREFVIIVTRGSSKTGQPYAIKFPDGTRRELKAILMNELDYLEEYLARAETSSLVAPETTRMEQPQDLKPTPESHIHRSLPFDDRLMKTLPSEERVETEEVSYTVPDEKDENYILSAANQSLPTKVTSADDDLYGQTLANADHWTPLDLMYRDA